MTRMLIAVLIAILLVPLAAYTETPNEAARNERVETGGVTPGGLRETPPASPEGMVLIPAGELMMGFPPGEGKEDTHPQHKVYLDAFYMDKYEVTLGQYKKFISATGHRRLPDRVSKYLLGDDHPVVGVSWEDAAAYARWAGKRLPTETEWEYAARGTDGRRYPWGNEAPDDGGRHRANYGLDESVSDGYEYTSPVGSFESGKSPYGVYDMAGNVWEWCSDWYDSDYYWNSPSSNPKGPAKGENRKVIRGGSWNFLAYGLRSAVRGRSDPKDRAGGIGFRCVRDVSDHELEQSEAGRKARKQSKERLARAEAEERERDQELLKKALDEMVLIPAGTFMMGSPSGEGLPGASPEHEVFVDSFYIGKYEVTFEQYDLFCRKTGRKMPSHRGWGRGTRPVICVSWHDAVAFCDWLSEMSGKKYRLPTEAEWEKAARGTDGRKYPWGNEAPDSGGTYRANYDPWGIKGDGYEYTSPVGSFESGKSPYGVYDMAGNVWEWCSDWYGEDYYGSSSSSNPKGPTNGEYRVLRGGSWNDADVSRIRSAYRIRSRPDDNRGTIIGFRCARDE